MTTHETGGEEKAWRGMCFFWGVKRALFCAAAALVLGGAVMLLWNHALVDAAGLRAVGYWQAVGLLVLSRILFGAYRGGCRSGHWKERMRERWERMTPEEREKFRSGLWACCGGPEVGKPDPGT